MLFVAILAIIVMIFLIHVTKQQLVEYLQRGDIDGALRILTMFDKVD